MLKVNHLTGFGKGGGYRANAVTFDGSTTYLSDATFSEAAGKLVTASLWFRVNSLTTARLFSDTTTWRAPELEISGGNLNYQHETAFENQTIRAYGSTDLTGDTSWHHYIISCDVTDSGKRHCLFDGADESPSWSTYQNENLAFNQGFIVGATQALTRYFNGDMAELYFTNEYIDLSVASNLEKFIKDGKPVFLGDDGSLPTGTQPLIFLSGSTASWHTNKGSGGGLTETGTLTTAATSPSD